jgi:hypothetical protein
VGFGPALPFCVVGPVSILAAAAVLMGVYTVEVSSKRPAATRARHTGFLHV